jgi:catecholate siderophore receptor
MTNKKRKIARSIFPLINALMMIGGVSAQNSSSEATPPEGIKEKKTPPPLTGASVETTELPEVVVTAKAEDTYQTTESANGKYTGPLRDVPQTVTVVPKAVMQDQNASSMRDVLRNVSGITFQSGEGGALAGDNLLIRGFNARSDMFMDGIRDGGAYNRDAFNLEQVEVAKGPASTYSGHGSTGGSVNSISKLPQLGNFYEASTGYGTDQYFRETVDLNQNIPNDISGLQGSAVRVTGMFQSNEHSDRDFVKNNRWGIAPSITTGLGTDTKVTLAYFHQAENNLLSYGIPTVNAAGVAVNPQLAPYVGHPAPVHYSNFYGNADRDYEHTTTDIPTLKFEHEFDDDLKVTNTSRYARTYRDSGVSSPRFNSAMLNPNGGTFTTTALAAGNVGAEYKVKHQLNELLGNSTEVTHKFETWSVPHTFVGTVEFYQEREETHAANGTPIQLSLNNPNSYAYYPINENTVRYSAPSASTLDSQSFSLFDTAKLTKQWELSYGMRFDHLESHYKTDAIGAFRNSTNGITAAQAAQYFHRTDNLASWKTALAYKPVESGTIYFGYGTSFNPSIEGTTAGGGGALSSSLNTLEPESSHSYEMGAKWDLLKQNLSLNSAIFRTNKTNQRIVDPTNSAVFTLGGESRVQGFEFGATGNITDEWKVFGGYTWMESAIIEGKQFVGNRLPNTPSQTASFWTTYRLPAGFEVGTGAQFVDKRFENINNLNSVDGYWKQDAMLSYRINKNFDVQLNVMNVWSVEYIDVVGNNQNTPGDGRSFVLSATAKF